MGNGRAISATLATASVGVLVWIAKQYAGIEIPPDVSGYLVVIVTGVSLSAPAPSLPAFMKRKEPTA